MLQAKRLPSYMSIQKLKRTFLVRLSTAWQRTKLRISCLPKRSLFYKGSLLQSVAIGVVVLGIVFRLGNLSLKPYWEDEVYTSTLVSGYEIEDIKADISNRLVSVESLAKYQDVRLGKSWQDTAIALAKRPEHTPLYFLLARVWALCFGSSEAAMRAFPAMTSLLTLPLFYWLAYLLFESAEVATITLCLACTSPIFIRYAQDARPYSLWIVGMLLSSVMLLKALRSNQKRRWALYSFSVAFSGLTHWLSGFIFLAHSLYVLLTDRNISKPVKRIRIKRFLVALSIGLLPLLPWLGLVIYGRYSVRAVLSWLEQEETFVALMVKWLGNISHLVFAELPPGNSSLLLVAPLLVLIAWSAAQTVVKTRSRQWLLPVLFCLIPTMAFVLPDLLFGGTRSLISRYFLPVDIGLLLILGFGLSGYNLTTTDLAATDLAATDLAVRNAKWTAKAKQVLFYAVLTVSISACWFNFTANSWWGETDSGRDAAAIAMQTASAVDVYSDSRLSPFLAFALSLRTTDRIMWLDAEVPVPLTSELLDTARVSFLFEPSPALCDRVRQAVAAKGFQLEPVPSHYKKRESLPLFQITPLKRNLSP